MDKQHGEIIDRAAARRKEEVRFEISLAFSTNRPTPIGTDAVLAGASVIHISNSSLD